MVAAIVGESAKGSVFIETAQHAKQVKRLCVFYFMLVGLVVDLYLMMMMMRFGG
jgi:hypothetical protein